MRSNTRVAGPTELARDARVENLTPDLVLVCPETRETQLARVDRKASQMSKIARTLGQSGESGCPQVASS